MKRSDFNAHWFLSMAKKSGYVSPDLDELLKKTANAKSDGNSQNEGIDNLFGDGGSGAVTDAKDQGSRP